MRAVAAYLAAEHRRHPWIAPGLALTGSAALGRALLDITLSAWGLR